MSEPLKVCFALSEADPLIKVGGLGDVGGTLPRALNNLPKKKTDGRGIDARVVIPYHDILKEKQIPVKWLFNFKIPYENGFQDVYVSQAENMPVPTYLIDGDPIRGKGVYSSDTVADGYKYIFFSAAVVEMFRYLKWIPDVFHAHDWHAGASVMKMKQIRAYDPAYHNVKTLFTIHNLPYSGGNHPEILEKYGIQTAFSEDIPGWLRGCPMGAGLFAADKISTVSETYSREIMTQEYGHGYETYLTKNSDKVCGIVNGIEPAQWDPSTDRVLYENFSLDSFEKRIENKRMLQREMGLPQWDNVPLIIMIGRLDYQKGFDLAFSALRILRNMEWQAVILGSGNPAIQNDCMGLAAEFHDKVRAIMRYDAALSRKMYAGGDILLMPSRYEPCGIAQMIAMLYGCIPVAHATGGLKDTITDPIEDYKNYTGYLFDEASPNACANALRRSIESYQSQDSWQILQKRCMGENFSWENSALKYYELYKSL